MKIREKITAPSQDSGVDMRLTCLGVYTVLSEVEDESRGVGDQEHKDWNINRRVIFCNKVL